MKLNATALSQADSKHHAATLRFLVIVTLMSGAALIGFFSYSILNNLEHERESEQYSSLVVNIKEATNADLARKLASMKIMRSIILHDYPEIEQWPNVSLSFDYFNQIADDLLPVIDSTSISIAPLVEQQKRQEFLEFAYNYFANNNISSEYFSPQGEGIYTVNLTNGQRYIDYTNSPYAINPNALFPNFLFYGPEGAYPQMINAYHDEEIVSGINYALNCSLHATSSDEINTKCNSDSMLLHKPTGPEILPYNLLILPITIANNESTIANNENEKASTFATVVGIIAASHAWTDTLSTGIAKDQSGIDIILEVNVNEMKSSYSFQCDHGECVFHGFGRLYDKDYASQEYSFPVEGISNPALQFTVYVYPNSVWMNYYITNIPSIASAVTVGIMVFTCLLILFYDMAMKKTVLDQEIILQTKRQFVRYISHEMRTPMNVVLLGVKVMTTEMNKVLETYQKHHKIQPEINYDKFQRREDSLDTMSETEENMLDTESYLQSWLQTTSDIAVSCDAAIAVLNDLLSYDKLQTGQMNIERKEVNLWNTLKVSTRLFEVQAKHSSIHLSVDCEVDHDNSILPDQERMKLHSLVVMGDIVKLDHVIRNLISNALKFTPVQGKVTVQAIWNRSGLPEVNPSPTTTKLPTIMKTKIFRKYPQIYSVSNRAGSIVISVTDTGVGLSAENLKNLFQEGMQFDVNKLQSGNGSGLGLFISKGIIELHGGRMFATSPGEKLGSTFSIELPVYWKRNQSTHRHSINLESSSKSSNSAGIPIEPTFQQFPLSPTPEENEEQEQPQEVVQEKEDEEEEEGRKEKLNILIVDDSQLNRKLLTKLLTSSGLYSCLEAADGLESVEMVTKAMKGELPTIDIILMDYEMPRMNGPDATAALLSLGSKIPVIGITGNILPEDREYFTGKGAVQVLQKPVAFEQLNLSIHETISVRSNVT